MVRSINDTRIRARTLAAFAAAMAKAGLTAESTSTFGQAIEIAQSSKDERTRDSALTAIALVQADARRTEQALEVARSLGNVGSRSHAVGGVAVVEAEAGNFGNALRLARSVEDDWYRASTLSNIAARQAKQGLTEDAAATAEDAMRIARSIKYPKPITGLPDTGEALRMLLTSDISSALAKAGKVAEALQAAEQITDWGFLSLVLRDVASAQAKAGRMDAARASFEAALQAGMRGASTSIVPGDARARVLAGVSEAQAEAGLLTEALQVVRSIESHAHRASALGKLAARQAMLGKVAVASEITLSINEPRDQKARSQALTTIAEVEPKPEIIADTLRFAASLTGENDRKARAIALGNVAAAQSRAVARKEGTVTFEEAIQVAKSAWPDDDRALALIGVAGAQGKSGLSKEAAATAVLAIPFVSSITDGEQRARALADLVAAQVKAGDPKGAAVPADLAIQAIQRSITSEEARGRALTGLVRALLN
jgi:tetratricopeptide (TPR) repeat protein